MVLGLRPDFVVLWSFVTTLFLSITLEYITWVTLVLVIIEQK